MNESLCNSCDYSISIKYYAKDRYFIRMKCCKLMEYVEKYNMEYCSQHSNLPSIEQIKKKIDEEYKNGEVQIGS